MTHSSDHAHARQGPTCCQSSSISCSVLLPQTVETDKQPGSGTDVDPPKQVSYMYIPPLGVPACSSLIPRPYGMQPGNEAKGVQSVNSPHLRMFIHYLPRCHSTTVVL